MNYTDFDILRYLEDRNIPHKTSGKNVSSGWVNIQCVNPLCDDHSNHLGINLSTKFTSCWKCGKKGSAADLIMNIDSCGYAEAMRIMEQYLDPYATTASPKISTPTGSLTLPKGATSQIPTPHHRYLAERGYNATLLRDKYGLVFCYTIGKYRHRIIAPIFIGGRMVNYVARDVTGLSEKKYKMAPNSEALMHGSSVVYNIDNIKSSAVAIVEGIFDVWRIGDGAIGIFGTALTEEKITLLVQKNISKAFVIYDEDAKVRQDEVANKVSKLIKHTEKITLTNGDPDKYFLNNPNDLKDLQFLLGI